MDTHIAGIRGLWEDTAPASPPAPVLRETLSVDVVVVGAGYTGLSAALHLALKGASVAVLESVDVGFGGSGRNVGLVNAGMWVSPDEVAATLGPRFGERLLRVLGEAPGLVFELIDRYEIQCEPERQGTLHCAVGNSGLKDLERRAAQWQARGAPVHLLSAAQTAGKLGTPVYAGSLWDQRAGTIQPLGYARGRRSAPVSSFTPAVPCAAPPTITAAGRFAPTWAQPSRSGSSWRPTHTPRVPGPASTANRYTCRISIYRRHPSMPDPWRPYFPNGRAPGIRKECSAPSGWTAPGV